MPLFIFKKGTKLFITLHYLRMINNSIMECLEFWHLEFGLSIQVSLAWLCVNV